MFYPEPLFFIQDKKTKIFKCHIPGKQPVGSNNDIDFTVSQFFDDVTLLTWRTEPAQAGKTHRKPFKPFRKSGKMLFSQNSCRNQNGHLFTIIYRHEGCAQSHFGFSAGTAVRWAAPQTRLALSDISDERIPSGGTPGFAVWDLRFSYRQSTAFLASLTFENLLDTAFRYHGSSVNGSGRGFIFMVDIGPVWKW